MLVPARLDRNRVILQSQSRLVRVKGCGCQVSDRSDLSYPNTNVAVLNQDILSGVRVDSIRVGSNRRVGRVENGQVEGREADTVHLDPTRQAVLEYGWQQH